MKERGERHARERICQLSAGSMQGFAESRIVTYPQTTAAMQLSELRLFGAVLELVDAATVADMEQAA